MKPARRLVTASIATIALSLGAFTGVAGAEAKSDTQAGDMKKQCREGTVKELENGWTCFREDGKQQTCLKRRGGGYNCWVTEVKPSTGGGPYDHVATTPGDMVAQPAPSGGGGQPGPVAAPISAWRVAAR